MQSLTTHYQQLLGLPSTWKVENVDLSMTGLQVVIRLVYIGKNIECPECGEPCGIYDHAPEQNGVIWIPCSLKPSLLPDFPVPTAPSAESRPSVPHGRTSILDSPDVRGFVVQLLQHCATRTLSQIAGAELAFR